MEPFARQFSGYFERPVALRAAKSLSPDAVVEFKVDDESFFLTRKGGQNQIVEDLETSPDLTFTLTAGAAQAILDFESDDVGLTGVEIAKMIVSLEPGTPPKKVWLKLNAGFFTLFRKGYLGVITAGGASFAQFLAARGLVGVTAIKQAIQKMRNK
ncbi:MAG: hypothetical protein AB7P04_02575 [Bacteriovoracia bacterium]